jgi:enoyl-CoA hydratase
LAQTTLNLKVSNYLAELTISRPSALNALNDELLTELERSIADLEPRDDVRVLIITGEGRAFVSGGDIAQMAGLDPVSGRAFARLGQRVFNRIEASRLPVIAAINGFAFGGGLELALACDLRMAAEEASLGLPEVGLGIIPGFGGTQRLSRICGAGAAKDLILTGRRIPAAEALAIGLVNSVHPKEELLQAARAKGELISSRSPFAVSVAKKLVTAGAEAPLQTGLEYEADAFALCLSHEDSREGLRAFVEKRPATWGRSRANEKDRP